MNDRLTTIETSNLSYIRGLLRAIEHEKEALKEEEIACTQEWEKYHPNDRLKLSCINLSKRISDVDRRWHNLNEAREYAISYMENPDGSKMFQDLIDKENL